MSTEEHDESAFSGEMSHFYPRDHVSSNEAVSKWKSKGKRNIRNLTKRSVDTSDGKGSIHGTYEKGSRLSQRILRQNLSLRRDEDFDYSVEEDDIIENDFGTQRVKLDGRDSLASRAPSRGRHSVGHNIFDWDDFAWEDQPALKGYWGIKGERFDPYFDGNRHFGGRSRSMLVNVDLKVQAGYQKEPVPIVSLMSKLNGKAIIGHPIQIEKLEDGSAETLLSTVDDFGNEVFNNENSALQPAWRTARRTANVRVPRPHLSSALDSDETPNDLPYVDQERKPPFKKLNAGSSSHKSILERSNLPIIPRPPTDRKVLKKPPKKGSLSASQKTRTLSSIAIEQNLLVDRFFWLQLLTLRTPKNLANALAIIVGLPSEIGSKALPVARSLLSDALRIDPTNRMAWYYLGMVHRDDGRIADAADCFQAASMLEESDPIESFVYIL
uniref:Uncharacterized protein n=1 Tax=Fagus sylvatica TaxID=28930 RepID=A0A2N9ISD4_FAGSY